MGRDGEAPAPKPGTSSGGTSRASTLRAIGTVLVIALVAAGGFVVFARSQAAVEPPSGGLNEEVPSALADGREPGTVPDQIAAAVGAPVLAAVRLDELSDGLEDCAAQPGLTGEPELEFAVVTPEGASVSLIGNASADFQAGFGEPTPAPPTDVPEPPSPAAGESPSEPFRWTCGAQWADGEWQVTVGSQGPAGQSFQGSGGTCCDSAGNAMASAVMTVPEGTAWLVQDREGYRLAYPVEGLQVAAVTWGFGEGGAFVGTAQGAALELNGPTGTLVLLLNAEGDVLEERFVSTSA